MAVLAEKQRTIDWHSQYLIIPLPHPMKVAQGDSIQIGFSYEAGASLGDLEDSMKIAVQAASAYYIPPASAGAA